jgi:hypothetical protein
MWRRGHDGSHRRRPTELYGAVLTLGASMSPCSRTAARNAAGGSLLPFLADLLCLNHAVSDHAPTGSGLAAPHPSEPCQSPDVPRDHRFLCRRPMATRRGSQRIMDGGNWIDASLTCMRVGRPREGDRGQTHWTWAVRFGWVRRENAWEMIWCIRSDGVIFSRCICGCGYSIGHDCGVSIYGVAVD